MSQSATLDAAITELLPAYAGETVTGPQVILADQDDDLTAHTSWAADGYCLGDFQPALVSTTRILRSVTALVCQRIEDVGLHVPANFTLENYHQLPGLTHALHCRIAAWAVPLVALGIEEAPLVAMLEAHLGVALKLLRPRGAYFQENCGLRVVRPQVQDFNPFHRDGWLDTCKASVNAWIPLVACTAGSSLRVFPGSHRWPESAIERSRTGAQIGNNAYRVPAVTKIWHRATAIEPLPQWNQYLLFSNYLIHGAAQNNNPNTTRVSIEVRFTRA